MADSKPTDYIKLWSIRKLRREEQLCRASGNTIFADTLARERDRRVRHAGAMVDAERQAEYNTRQMNKGKKR